VGGEGDQKKEKLGHSLSESAKKNETSRGPVKEKPASSTEAKRHKSLRRTKTRGERAGKNHYYDEKRRPTRPLKKAKKMVPTGSNHKPANASQGQRRNGDSR